MSRENQFSSGDVAAHFKRWMASPAELSAEPMLYLYEIIGVAEHTESGEELMVYRSLYGQHRLFARPLAMFLSETDTEKYPGAEQKYRFEKYDIKQ